jgi:hypothetical protein
LIDKAKKYHKYNTFYNLSCRCREVIMRVLKPAPTATTVNFLQFISRIKSKESRELNLKDIHFRFNISCTEGADGGDGAYRLAIEAQSELDAVQSLDTGRMERVGSCILDLLQQFDFKSSPLVLGELFVQCLEHLALLLCKKTGYTHPKERVC